MSISHQTLSIEGGSWMASSWAQIALCLVLVVCLSEEASSQPPKPAPKNPPQKKDVKKVEEIVIDPEKLPLNFEPPKQPLAMMNLEMPIATPEELAKLRREWQKFSKVKSDCDLSPAGRKVIEASIRYRLAAMTMIKPSEMRDDPKKILQMRQDLIRELSATAIGNPAKRPADIAATSEVLNREVLKQIPELLKNNFYVRLSAVLILSEMDYKLAYVPAYEILLQVITAKDAREDEIEGQPEAIKINAVKGLIRILRFSNCPVRDRTIICNVIIQELKKKDAFWWRQERMIEAIRYCGISGVDAGNNNHPFVIECLLSIIKDPKRDWRVRAKACYCLGRVPLPAGIKPEDMVIAVAEFGWHLANAAAAEPEHTIWRSCFWDLYMAFHAYHRPRDKEQDLDAEEKRDGGLLNAAKAAAQPAYELIVPLVNDVLNGKAPDAGNLKRLGDYVRSRLPSQELPSKSQEQVLQGKPKTSAPN